MILVNRFDQEVGVANKLPAHQHGWLHRAFSIQLFAQQHDRVYALLQQRASHKYHCAQLWTNTCCSHFTPGWAAERCVVARLQEEMGLQHNDLRHCAQFCYRAELANGLIEHEFDHVYIGWMDCRDVPFNPDEVMAYRWQEVAELEQLLATNPEQFTPWFPQVFQHAVTHLSKHG